MPVRRLLNCGFGRWLAGVPVRDPRHGIREVDAVDLPRAVQGGAGGAERGSR